MSNVHLLARDINDLDFDKFTRLWTTSWWVMSSERAAALVGNRVYLHQKQSERSYHGGRVVEVNPDPELAGRWWITYDFEQTARGVAHPTRDSRNPVVFSEKT